MTRLAASPEHGIVVSQKVARKPPAWLLYENRAAAIIPTFTRMHAVPCQVGHRKWSTGA